MANMWRVRSRRRWKATASIVLLLAQLAYCQQYEESAKVFLERRRNQPRTRRKSRHLFSVVDPSKTDGLDPGQLFGSSRTFIKDHTSDKDDDGKGSKSKKKSSQSPTSYPTNSPSFKPSTSPSIPPTGVPSAVPSTTFKPTTSNAPSLGPSKPPSARPSPVPSVPPTRQPSSIPTLNPTDAPSNPPSTGPSPQPSARPSVRPSSEPTLSPTDAPSNPPSIRPSPQPSARPSVRPSSEPSILPSSEPSYVPSSPPSRGPSIVPTLMPSDSPAPSDLPTTIPSTTPSASQKPSIEIFQTDRTQDQDGNLISYSRCEENPPIEASPLADQLIAFEYNIFLPTGVSPIEKTRELEGRMHSALAWRFMDCVYSGNDDGFEVLSVSSLPLDELSRSCDSQNGANCFTISAFVTAEIFYLLGRRRLADVISDPNIVEAFGGFLEELLDGDTLTDDDEIVDLQFLGFTNSDVQTTFGGTDDESGGESGLIDDREPADNGNTRILAGALTVGLAAIGLILVSVLVARRRDKLIDDKELYDEDDFGEVSMEREMISPMIDKRRGGASDDDAPPESAPDSTPQLGVDGKVYVLRDLEDLEDDPFGTSDGRSDQSRRSKYSGDPQEEPSGPADDLSANAGPREVVHGRTVFLTADTVDL